MILESRFSAGEKQQEILPMDRNLFPFICRRNDLNWYPRKAIPWHWHDVFEINYVVEGGFSWRTPDRVYTVMKGEIGFINLGILHTCTAAEGGVCKYYTLLFDMHFLTGLYNSIFEEKYVHPISRSEALPFWRVRPDNYSRLKMIETVLEIVELCRDEPFCYEFDVRSRLGTFWKYLLKDTEEARSHDMPKNAADTARIKQMMHFTDEHFAEKLTLADIAASADVSTRECTRSFRKNLGMSPTDYLTRIRLRQACGQLLDTGKSILEISEDCGFSSPSYFGKIFRETIGCTPKDYRKIQ